MKLHSENININEVVEILKIRKRFIDSENIDTGYYNLMQELIEYFTLDRIYIGMKNGVDDKCMPLVEYVRGKEPDFLGNIVDFGSYTKFLDIKVDEKEQEFTEFVDKKYYFLGDEFDELNPFLDCIDYKPSDLGKPKETLVFYIKNKESFSYMFMERYENRAETFTESEKLALQDMYNLFKIRIEKEILNERVYNEVFTKDAILKNEHMPVCILDKKTKNVISFNDYYKEFIPKVKVGENYNNLFSDNQLFEKDYTAELVPNSEILVNYNYVINGEEFVTYWIKKVIPLKLVDGTDVLMVYIKDTADYIRQLEGVDLLTSAYSMKGFSENFKINVERNRNRDYALCTLDIAKFKFINDTKGFSFGNKLLKKISEVLNKFTRSQEIYCRMNEDKFAILLQYDTEDEIKARINGLFNRLEVMRSDCFSDIGVTYVCGVTNVEKDVEVTLLIDRANMARKFAKGSHKNIISFFTEEMERKLNDESTIESRVAKAVEDGEFVPYLQPKFDLKTMKICGAEALVRWITPTGMIFPDSFIPLFEKNGFITTLDFIIYKKVMQYIRSCLDKGLKVYPISLNVSRNHIQNKNFVVQMMEIINEYKIPIDLLELEITESVFIEDREVLKFFVDNIKHIKVKVSIDDFGSAYSSLQILKDIDMDILKIDKGFLDNIGVEGKENFTKDEVVLKNIINLAKDLECKVICEGVETKEQIEVLRNIGCELGQGYIFSKPLPIQEYEEKFLK